MGRFDEWLTEDTGPDAQGDSNCDSQPTAATAPDTENAAREGNSATSEPEQASFRELEESPTSSNSTDSAGGDHSVPLESDEVAHLPASLATREQSTTLKPRYQGHKAFNDQIRQDWMVLIEEHQDAFQALLYRPADGTYGVIDDETGEESFTELDNNQRVLSYQEPVIVSVLDNPDGRESFRAVDSDTDQDGLTDDVLVLRIALSGIPVGSILEWNEEMSHSTVRRWWYVHRIFSMGTQHVGSLYYCIPARNFDSYANGGIQ